MNVYLKDLVALHDNPKFVVDVGGYLGDYASEVYKQFQSNVLIFEPLTDYADICSDRFTNNPNIKIIRMALGGSKGEAVIYKSKEASSLFQGLAMKGVEDGQEVVPAGKLSDFMRDDVDVLKLNCEGGEYEILYDLIETGWLPKIPEILIQFHRMKSHRDMFSELQEQLSKTHELTKLEKWQLWKKI